FFLSEPQTYRPSGKAGTHSQSPALQLWAKHKLKQSHEDPHPDTPSRRPFFDSQHFYRRLIARKEIRHNHSIVGDMPKTAFRLMNGKQTTMRNKTLRPEYNTRGL